jgi:hypothetical protein
MTPEEEHDFQVALLRIKDAEYNKNAALDLGGLKSLTRFPPELASLTSLQWLNFYECEQLSGDLSERSTSPAAQAFVDLPRSNPCCPRCNNFT